jgi:SAM-dependent methyltransferase
VGGLDYSALTGATYAVSSCPRCHTWFQTSIPSDALLGRLYEEWIAPEKARLRFHHNHSPHQCLRIAREVALSLSFARTGAPRTALDYGCGWGEWSRMTQAFGYESWGTELSGTRRTHAEKSGIRIVAEADLPSHHFSLINLDQVLEHVPNPQTTLSLLAAKLHPGGILRLAVPNAWKVARSLKNFDRELTRPRLGGLNAIAPLEHLNAFTHEGLVCLAHSVGLRAVRPTWRQLLHTLVLPPGLSAKAKSLIRLFYVRSRFSTVLFFAHSVDCVRKG